MSRPLSILGLAERAWTVLSFLAIVTQLVVIRGFERGVFYLFVVPPLLAMFLSSKSVHARGRFLAKLFLILVSCGLLLAWFPRICPDLRGVARALPPAQDRALTWYGIVYIAYVTCIVPIHVCLSELQKHRNQEPTQISKMICRLGIAAALSLGPFLILTMMSVMKFWPVFR